MTSATKLLFAIMGSCCAATTQGQTCTTPDLASLETWLQETRTGIQQSANLPPIGTTCPVSSDKQKVLLIGIDGLRADATAMLPLPNIRRLMAMGSWSFWARLHTSGTAVSGPGWSSLLTGVEPSKHLVDGNGDLRDLVYPTVLKMVKDSLGKTVAATVSWWPLIDDILGYQDSSTLDASFKADNDQEMVDKALEWIVNDNYDLIFLDFDECDGAGHGNGFDGYNPPYQNAVIDTDMRIGSVLDAIMGRSGEEWLIVVTTDHGGKGTSHGDQNDENRRVPLLVASNSPRVGIGPAPFDDPGSHMDVLPTILHFFGISIPNNLDGQVFGFLDYVRSPAPVCDPDPANCGCLDIQQVDYRGTISVTETGKTCQAWNVQSPRTHDRTPEEYPDAGLENNNHCRNPDGEDRSWCYTTTGIVRWEYCTVPSCPNVVATTPTPTASPTLPTAPPPTAAPTPPTTPAPSANPTAAVTPTAAPTQPPPATCPASDPSNCGCADVQQADYRGMINTTTTGRACQAWNVQFPHEHDLNPSNFPNSGLVGNYCRNPDGEESAWCYTTDSIFRWELCDVPTCGACTNPDDTACGCADVLQEDYRGTINTTVSGKTCQAWSAQFPHGHSRIPQNYPGAGLEENYCRNPDGEPGAWCYTMDEDTRFELCNVPDCGSSNRKKFLRKR